MTGQKLRDMEKKQETAILVNQCISDSLSAMHHGSTPVNQSNFLRASLEMDEMGTVHVGDMVMVMQPMPTHLSGETFQDSVEKQKTATRAKLGKQYLIDSLSAIRHDSTNQSRFATWWGRSWNRSWHFSPPIDRLQKFHASPWSRRPVG